MNYPDKMSDADAWRKKFIFKYQKSSTIALIMTQIATFPFALIYWAALHFEAAFDVLAARWDNNTQK